MVKNIIFIISIIIILIIIGVYCGKYFFNEYFKNKTIKLFSLSKDISNEKFNLENFDKLPEPVIKYLKYSLGNCKQFISSVKMKHDGKFKNPAGKWVDIEGIQYYTADNPGFVWKGNIPFATAMDYYINGRGRLMAKVLSFIKVMDSKSEKMDKAELIRWLTESVLYPTALLPSEKLKWEAIDASSAKLIFKDKDNIVESVVKFNDKNQIISFESIRFDGEKMSVWGGKVSNYTKVNGMMIPMYIEAYWKDDLRINSYAKFRINTVEYNEFELF